MVFVYYAIISHYFTAETTTADIVAIIDPMLTHMEVVVVFGVVWRSGSTMEQPGSTFAPSFTIRALPF